MAAALNPAPSASPPSSPAPAAPVVAVAAAEISSRPLIDEVLEEDFGTEEDIASAQAGINLAMSMEDIFGFSTEFLSIDVPDIQGETALILEAILDHL